MPSIKDNAVILKYIKYSDTAIILHAFTRMGGKQSFMAYGLGSRKKNLLAYFQPLYLHEIEYDHKSRKEIQVLNNYRLSPPLHNLSADIRKSTIAVFLADVLHHVLKHDDIDEDLFDFVWSAVNFLENINTGHGHFHLLFLIKLSRFLGYHFDFNRQIKSSLQWFDMRRNQMVEVRPSYDEWLSIDELEKISLITQTPFSDFNSINLSIHERNQLLKLMVNVFENYTLNFNSLKSYEVLKDVFS